MISPFSVSKRRDGAGVVRLGVVGEIDEDVSAALTEIIANVADQDGVAEVVVDLRRVSFLAAAGIRSLLQGRSEALRRGRAYRVVNAVRPVRRVLDVTGTAALLRLSWEQAPPPLRATPEASGPAAPER